MDVDPDEIEDLQKRLDKAFDEWRDAHSIAYHIHETVKEETIIE